MAKFKDLTGMKFDYLTVIERLPSVLSAGKLKTMWLCQCACGKMHPVSASSLTTGTTVSCGCKKRKHGYSHKERLYEIWLNMRRRCNDPTNKRYLHYGGKGVRTCEEWNDYSNFRTWALKNGYSDCLTIDRINNSGNYEPSNCRWATPKEQENNMSRNRVLEYKGTLHTMSEWADVLGMSYGTINHRVQRNWSMDRIVNTPQRRSASGSKALSARVS